MEDSLNVVRARYVAAYRDQGLRSIPSSRLRAFAPSPRNASRPPCGISNIAITIRRGADDVDFHKTEGMKVDVLTEVLQWSAERPAWQRDALRRLVQAKELTEGDLAELVQLCKTPHGLAEGGPAVPLAKDHLPAPGGRGEAVKGVVHPGVHRQGRNESAG